MLYFVKLVIFVPLALEAAWRNYSVNYLASNLVYKKFFKKPFLLTFLWLTFNSVKCLPVACDHMSTTLIVTYDRTVSVERICSSLCSFLKLVGFSSQGNIGAKKSSFTGNLYCVGSSSCCKASFFFFFFSFSLSPHSDDVSLPSALLQGSFMSHILKREVSFFSYFTRGTFKKKTSFLYAWSCLVKFSLQNVVS